jgi:hypothetical protein
MLWLGGGGVVLTIIYIVTPFLHRVELVCDNEGHPDCR